LEAAPAALAAVGKPAPARVLLADDNADMREYLLRLLQPGYEVTSVTNGRTALEAARANPPDIVISDVMMPLLGGLELVAALRSDLRTAEVPVLLLSARAGQEAAIEGLEAGADDYLVKPFSAAGLLATPGSAPYSVTKHAALAFAEWLSLTHRHRGLTVQAICPMGVRTGMFDGSDPQMEKLLGAAAIMPDDVADAVMEGIADGRFLILPHPDVAGMYAGRAAEPERWLHGMNKLQQYLEDDSG